MRFWLAFLILSFYTVEAKSLDSYADLVDELMPMVVNISTERQTTVLDENNIDNLMISPDLNGREALGSGFFVRGDGYILTNAHVINQAKKITVTTDNGKTYEAKLIGIDKPSDLAVLKIGETNNTKKESAFKYVKFGNADKARIGDKVLTFGNPYGLGISVSAGIISAKSRNIGFTELPYIQTDAAINEGNSGGPMFNLDGEVIGINAAVFTAKGASGVGFSLPSNIANWVSTQLIEKGKVRRSWTGMKVAAGVDNYTGKSGFVVTEIDEHSRAYEEGVRVGDVIIFYNDKPAQNVDDFLRFVETLEPEQALRLKTLSLGEEIRHVIRLQEMPPEALKSIANKALSESNKSYHEDLEKGIYYISELKIAVKESNPRGLQIVKIDKFSPLLGTGIAVDDILLEADNSDIYSTDNLLENIRNAISDDLRPITFLVQGIDNTFYASVTLEHEND